MAFELRQNDRDPGKCNDRQKKVTNIQLSETWGTCSTIRWNQLQLAQNSLQFLVEFLGRRREGQTG